MTILQFWTHSFTQELLIWKLHWKFVAYIFILFYIFIILYILFIIYLLFIFIYSLGGLTRQVITCLHLLPLPPLLSPPTRLFPSLTPVVVMAMESASASAPGVVAMEIPVRGALPVVEEDEGYSAPPGSEERLRYRRGGGRRRRGVPFNRGGYYMLIVIGEIGTEHQLDTARAQIERGEWWTNHRLVSVVVICLAAVIQCATLRWKVMERGEKWFDAMDRIVPWMYLLQHCTMGHHAFSLTPPWTADSSFRCSRGLFTLIQQ